MSSLNDSAFTLIELLVVIAIIAILAVVVVLTLNPAQLLAQSRDANRVSDMATLSSAIGFYQTDINGAGSIGISSTIYISLPDSTSTCANLGLPSLPSSVGYNCSISTSSRLINGQGWLPLDFTKISSGAPFGSLPIDPVNTSSSGFYYIYVASGTQYMITTLPESQKQKASLGQNSIIPNYPDVIANGSNVTISPLFNTSGLAGYWPMDEGAGSSTKDISGNNYIGIWAGTPAGINGTYYAPGKVGGWAGIFDGSSNKVTTSYSPSITSGISFSVWFNASNLTGYHALWGSNQNNFKIGFNGSSVLDVFWGAFTDGVTAYRNAPFNATVGAWYHLVVTFDGTTTRVYRNGVQIGSKIITSPVSPWANVAIGLRDPSNLEYFSGTIDDARIYSRALSEAEIQALYNAGK